jgi:hypothetical protein
MLRVVLALLKPGGELVLSLDSYQDLYMRRPSWRSVGIKAGGRTHYLKRVYRNTKAIFDFTQRFIGQEPGVNTQLALLPRPVPSREPRRSSGLGRRRTRGFLLEDLKGVSMGECKIGDRSIRRVTPDRFL